MRYRYNQTVACSSITGTYKQTTHVIINSIYITQILHDNLKKKLHKNVGGNYIIIFKRDYSGWTIHILFQDTLLDAPDKSARRLKIMLRVLSFLRGSSTSFPRELRRQSNSIYLRHIFYFRFMGRRI